MAFVIIAGAAVGVAANFRTLARLRLSDREIVATPAPAKDPRMPVLAPQGSLQPYAEADKEHFEYGVMERGSKLNHVFTIRNAGQAPLSLVKGHTTCRCTLSGLNKSELAPGESAEVRIDGPRH